MRLNNARLCRGLLETATQFAKQRLWEELSPNQCLALTVQSEQSPLYAVVGRSGEEFGLLLAWGEDGFRQLRALVSAPKPEEERMLSLPFMALSFLERSSVGAEFEKLYRNARWDVSPDQRVPFFVAHEPGEPPRPLTRKERELFLLVLNAILKAQELPEFKPSDIVSGTEVLTLFVTGEPLEPRVKVELRLRPEGSGTCADIPSTPLFALQGLPRLDATWLLATPVAPVSVQNDERTVNMVLVADEESETVLNAVPVPGMQSGDALQVLVRTCSGQGPAKIKGKPKELVVVGDRAFLDDFQKRLSATGIECRYLTRHPVIEEMMGSLFAHLSGRAEDARVDTRVVPDGDDLAAWKAVDNRLIERAIAAAGREMGDRAAARYFGSADLAQTHLSDEASGAPAAFLEWLFQDYQATQRGGTVLSRLLAQGMPAAEERLAKGRIGCPPSIYRVTALTSGKSVVLLDVLRGGSITVHDKAMSESAVADMFAVVRVYRAGSFHFVALAGPPLSGMHVDEAIAFLLGLGLKPTTEGLLEKAHLFGRLWEWTDNASTQPMPKLTTTEGDLLTFITATYKVGNDGVLRKALEAREDVETDETPDRYTWYRSASGEFGRTVRGSLSIVGDELLLEVSSERRLAEARSWLDAVPGLSYVGQRKRSVEELMAQGVPPDDDPERCGPQQDAIETAAMAEVTRKFLHDYYIKWLDEPLPALQGLTPRQACRTSEGKAHVAMLIRTIPPSGGPVRVEPPVQEMMDALGLDR